MTKSEFLRQLSDRLQSLPERDRTEALTYWSEMIDDRIEDGMTEEEAVRDIGTPEEAAARIAGMNPIHTPCAPPKEKRGLKVWEIVLLILGSPLWLSLLLAVFAVILSLYIFVWAVVLSLWAVVIAVTAVALPVIVFGIIGILSHGAGIGLLWIGAALLLFGIGLFLTAPCLLITKALCALTASIFRRKKRNGEKGI